MGGGKDGKEEMGLRGEAVRNNPAPSDPGIWGLDEQQTWIETRNTEGREKELEI